MTVQRVPLTAVNRRIKHIWQLAHDDGPGVLTSPDNVS